MLDYYALTNIPPSTQIQALGYFVSNTAKDYYFTIRNKQTDITLEQMLDGLKKHVIPSEGQQGHQKEALHTSAHHRSVHVRVSTRWYICPYPQRHGQCHVGHQPSPSLWRHQRRLSRPCPVYGQGQAHGHYISHLLSPRPPPVP